MGRHTVSFLQILLAATTLVLPSYQCQTDDDCSLNGRCSSKIKVCHCDPGWRGADCGELNVRPANRESGYNRTAEGISSWGSKIVVDPHDSRLHHLFLAEFEHGCGLDFWSPFSRIIRAESHQGAAGPYKFAAEVVSAFAHNPSVVWSPIEQEYLLYYIGCEQNLNASACTASDLTCGPGNFINGESGISIQTSKDLRHWKPKGQVFKGSDDMQLWDADTTNPSPHPLLYPPSYSHEHKSGMLLAYRGCPYNCPGNELISLAIAPCATGPYTRLNNHEPIFPDSAEDPFVWQDKRGHFHMLVHSLEAEGGFGRGPKVGRHAYARRMEGPWTFAGGNRSLAFSTHADFDDGSSINFYRRERPQLLFSDDGTVRPLFLTTGVQENNSPMSYTLIVPLGE
ncbi:Hypothetical protein R9X50_00026200 [Acrodontium crateriforme]|uniref:EGF-like domain-containing protein n=1 Tax=Acrodontium crateriforme TaxID=150365 RepID=A0AAQ3R1X3_9PEZI|nr:Hypothetical protein R9X50_00026200 [Acrodontium crateriforme]